MATPRADRDVWTLDDLAAELGFCTRTIRDALRFRPHTLPEPIEPVTRRGGLRWSKATVEAFMRASRETRRRGTSLRRVS